MSLARRLCLAVIALLLLPAAAAAEPSYDVSASPAVLRDWRTPVQYRLTITAGVTAEHFYLQVPRTTERGPGLTLVGAGLASETVCAGARRHTARGGLGGSYELFRVDLEPGQSTYVVTGTRLPGPPRPDDSLAFWASISAVEGGEAPQTTRLGHPGPSLRMPRGVPIQLTAAPGPPGWIKVSGVATGLPAGERIRIKAFPPGATAARLVATARVGREGRFRAAFPAHQEGVWDVYARYRSRLPQFASDASPCSVPVQVGPTWTAVP